MYAPNFSQSLIRGFTRTVEQFKLVVQRWRRAFRVGLLAVLLGCAPAIALPLNELHDQSRIDSVVADREDGVLYISGFGFTRNLAPGQRVYVEMGGQELRVLQAYGDSLWVALPELMLDGEYQLLVSRACSSPHGSLCGLPGVYSPANIYTAEFSLSMLSLLQGEKGERGEQGVQGEQGVPGVKGERGERGEQGPPGAQGEGGERGEKGEKGDPGSDNAWGLTGNGGLGQAQFLGTTDNRSLRIKVNNQTAMRLEPHQQLSNIIGGSEHNTVVDGAYGVTIAGGGGTVVSEGHQVSNNYGTIGGGHNNRVGGFSGDNSTRQYATVAGGYQNEASGTSSVVSGGQENAASGVYSRVGGGKSNTASGYASAVSSGLGNVASGAGSYVGSGVQNRATETYSVVGGGFNNAVEGGAATVSGGNGNSAPADYSGIGSGYQNTASGQYARVGGGWDNEASGYASVAAGGFGNVASGNYATVAGGTLSEASGYASYAVGDGSKATATGSYALGRQANANHRGAFVYADHTNHTGIGSLRENEFAAYATGGFRFATSTTTGCYILPGGGSWSCTSDRNAKDDFAPIDAQEVLTKVASLPISSWVYKTEPGGARHLGPMAQDFHAAFGLGGDDRSIGLVDVAGVALAAIQGLNQRLEEQDAQIQGYERQLTELREQMASLMLLQQVQFEQLGQQVEALGRLPSGSGETAMLQRGPSAVASAAAVRLAP